MYSLGTCVLKSPEESLLYSPIVYFPLIVCGILLLLFFVLLAMAYQKARSEIGMEEYVRDVSRCWNARTLLSLSLSLSHTHTHTHTNNRSSRRQIREYGRTYTEQHQFRTRLSSHRSDMIKDPHHERRKKAESKWKSTVVLSWNRFKRLRRLKTSYFSDSTRWFVLSLFLSLSHTHDSLDLLNT